MLGREQVHGHLLILRITMHFAGIRATASAHCDCAASSRAMTKKKDWSEARMVYFFQQKGSWCQRTMCCTHPLLCPNDLKNARRFTFLHEKPRVFFTLFFTLYFTQFKSMVFRQMKPWDNLLWFRTLFGCGFGANQALRFG